MQLSIFALLGAIKAIGDTPEAMRCLLAVTGRCRIITDQKIAELVEFSPSRPLAILGKTNGKYYPFGEIVCSLEETLERYNGEKNIFVTGDVELANKYRHRAEYIYVLEIFPMPRPVKNGRQSLHFGWDGWSTKVHESMTGNNLNGGTVSFIYSVIGRT